jgi:hypothetical protein
MFWRIGSLPPETRDLLARVSRDRSVAGTETWFQSRHRPGLLFLLLLVGGGVSLGLALGFPDALSDRDWIAVVLLGAIGATAVVWTAALLLELVRGATADVRPFVLLTPAVVVRGDYAHGVLEARRLADATGFESVNHYDGKQQFASREYVFKYPGRVLSLKVAAGPGLERVESLLAQARAGARDTGEAVGLVPSDEGLAAAPALRQVTNPLGTFWQGVLAIVIVLFIVAVGLGRVALG